MTDRALVREVLTAFSGITEGQGPNQLLAQEAALESLILRLEEIKRGVGDKRRVAEALETRDKRLGPGQRAYGVHLRHCYGLDYDSTCGDERPTERYPCKYGEDDICPAAMFEDPWAEYVRAEEAGEL